MSGNIYNKPELCSRAGIDGSVRDPRLIEKLFNLYGSGFAEMLNGDFIIFIYLAATGEAYLYRDQPGIRPAAWVMEDKTFTFSSDLYGLCRQFSKSGSPDQEFLLGHFKYIDFKKLPEKSAQKLLPGHFIRLASTGITLTRYWNPGNFKVNREMSYGKMIKQLGELLRDSVSIRSDRRFTAGAHVNDVS